MKASRLEDGTVRAWGDNEHGQSDVPDDLGPAIAVDGGYDHSVALLADGTVQAWGDNGDGQLDVPDDLGPVADVVAGRVHNVALLTDGSARAWGENLHGQSDVPDDLGEVAAVAAGDRHSVALLADGTVRAWGSNTNGQTDVPNDLGEVVAIAAGHRHNVALLADGTVRAWGYEQYGQTDVPGDLDQVIAVAAGAYHSLAIAPGVSTETVVSAESNPAVVGDPVELTATVSSDGGHELSGTVRFTVDGTVVDGCSAVAVDGVDEARCEAPAGTSVGEREVVAEYSGDGIHDPSASESLFQETVKADTSTGLVVEPAEPVFGEMVELTATVRTVPPGHGAVDGALAFTDGDLVLYEDAFDSTSAEDGSVATFTTSALDVGTYELRAEYVGSANFNESASDVVTVVVAKAPQTITFDELPDVTYGEVESFEVSASASSGLDVSFTAAGPCAVDDAVVTVTGVGECTVTAHQEGNADWLAAEPVAQSFTIEGAPADVQVTGWEHVYDGESHGVEVTTDPEGLDVEVTYDGEPVEPVDAGSYEVVVRVTDPDYVMDPVTGTMVIAKADQQISLAAPESVVFGDDSFEVVASASSELPVTVAAAGACTVDGSVATPSGAGECALTAEQAGDENWNAAATVTHTVAVDPAPSTTTLSASATATTVGEPVKFNVEVAAAEGTGTPVGSVTFTTGDDTAEVVELDEDGVASWTASDLAVGEYSVTAEYAGQGDHAGSVSEPVEHEVVTAELSLTGLPGEVMAGEEVTVDVTGFVPGEDVELVLHSEPVTVATVTADAVGAATATFEVPDVAAGEHRLVATGVDSGLTVDADTTVVEPKSSPEPTPEPTSSPEPEPGLPDTGSGSSGLAVAGLLLVGLGVLGLHVARRTGDQVV